MVDHSEVNSYLVKLRRLWKGTLYIALVAIYVSLIVAALALINWQAALVVMALISLSQVFRYVADEVDRIGWVLSSQSSDDATVQQTVRMRLLLISLLVLLVQAPNIAVVVLAYVHVESFWVIVCVGLVVAAELLFLEVRRVNRQVAYREASYGRHEPFVPGATVGAQVSHDRASAALQDRLDALEQLAKEGKISSRAYENARDSYWIRHIMERTD